VAFEELQERFKSEWQATADRFQENPLVQKVKDRYDNLPPEQQKVANGVGVFVIAAILFSIPYGFLSTSWDYNDEFQSKRDLIRNLLRDSRESQSLPQISPPPESSQLKALIESRIDAAQMIAEQKLGVSAVEAQSQLITDDLTQSAFQISLRKLNLKQITDLAYSIQSINPSVKVTDLVLKANSDDGRYLDMNMKVIALKVPSLVSEGTEESP